MCRRCSNRAAGMSNSRDDAASGARGDAFESRDRWRPNASATASSCSHRPFRPPSRRSTGIDAVSDFPGVDSITVHQGPGADLDWKDGSRNHIMAVVGSAADYAELLGGRPPSPPRGHGHVRRRESLLVPVRLTPAALARDESRSRSTPMTCAFVNNMPDGAFDATERQFLEPARRRLRIRSDRGPSLHHVMACPR